VVSDANADILVDEVSLAENIERAPLLGSVLELSC
jgi:ParB family chromosome partitioning protein